jgi:hypothetical protein
MRAIPESVAIDAEMRRLKGAYYLQKSNAKRRGVGWELTFDKWLEIWRRSGHLEERGVTKGRYCMARRGDVGPYAESNVRIARVEENLREARETDRYKK